MRVKNIRSRLYASTWRKSQDKNLYFPHPKLYPRQGVRSVINFCRKFPQTLVRQATHVIPWKFIDHNGIYNSICHAYTQRHGQDKSIMFVPSASQGMEIQPGCGRVFRGRWDGGEAKAVRRDQGDWNHRHRGLSLCQIGIFFYYINLFQHEFDWIKKAIFIFVCASTPASPRNATRRMLHRGLRQPFKLCGMRSPRNQVPRSWAHRLGWKKTRKQYPHRMIDPV